MSWWEYIPAVVSAVSTIVGTTSANKQNANQQGVNNYNTIEGYRVSMANIDSSLALSSMNAMLMMGAAKSKASNIQKVAQYNADMIWATTEYNDMLYQEDLTKLWESANLDTEILHLQRARERGAMEATQSASGTLMGQDSNADVIIDQMTMEALDAFVIQRNADMKAKDILNARARNLWEGNATAQKIMWEGQMESVGTLNDAQMSAAGSLVEAGITAGANQRSAQYMLSSGLISGQNTFSANSTQINNSFASGMFGAVGSGISTYYKNEERDARNKQYSTTKQVSTDDKYSSMLSGN